jgi:CelD/BcsL family acetyltransferase involved in cellulose biosynthesis
MASEAPTVEQHTGDLATLEAAWSRLVPVDHPGAPFRSFAWLSTWWKTFSTGRDPYVLVARRGGDVVGILPLYRDGGLLGGRLALMGDGIVGSDYLGALARPDDQPAVTAAIAAHLDGAGVHELVLDGLDRADLLTRALTGARALEVAVEPYYRCPHVRLSSSFDAYLDGLPQGAGAQWHRRRKWLEHRPGYRIDVLRTPSEIAAGMEILFDLHRRRWAIEGGSQGIDGPRTERFHRAAAARLAACGWARIFVLSVEGGPRAALYGFRHADRFAFYQAGYEPAWRPRSVGTVLLGHVLQQCVAEGLREFDFLRGSEEYKLRWATGWRETVRVHARGRGLRPWLAEHGRAAWVRLRDVGKRALPPSAVEWVQRARRRRAGELA